MAHELSGPTTLFVPGMASYLLPAEDSHAAYPYTLHLTEGAQHRADVAVAEYSSTAYDTVIMAGGWPGVEGWTRGQIPPKSNREAHLLARPLEDRLSGEGLTEAAIATIVLKQPDSNNTIGDVRESIVQGMLNADDFHHDDGTSRRIRVVAGIQARRTIPILRVALGNPDPALFERVNIRDIHGRRPEHAGVAGAAEMPLLAKAKAVAGVYLTRRVLKDVKPGDLESLHEAEVRLMQTVTRSKNPIIGRSDSQP